jgi:subtilisin family serine protease
MKEKRLVQNVAFYLCCGLSLFILSGCPASSSGDDDDEKTYTDTSNAGQQWHLQNIGQKAYASGTSTPAQDINQATTYSSGIDGSGVIVAVVDTGLEIAHADLAANVLAGQSWDFNGTDTDPTNTGDTSGDHGTSVSGIIAAVENTIGGRGVAPAASLKGFNYLSSNQAIMFHVDSLGGSSSDPTSDNVHIFNMSYGYSNSDDILIDSTLAAHLQSATENLRSNLGAIFVKSAGNGFESFGSASCSQANAVGLSCQNVSNDPVAATPWMINVGALNAEGVRSSYSTAGSGVWISAPGGEYGYDETVYPGLVAKAYKPAILTTDQSGCNQGYANTVGTPANKFQNNANGENGNCDFTSTFNGTSSAAPVVSGSIALILEANPNLTWRDIKHILASTARKVDASQAGVTVTLGGGDYKADLGWITNAAGYHFHNWYGFGAIDVDAAVTIAKSYSSSLGTLTHAETTSSGSALSIPDNDKDGAQILFNFGTSLTIESVQLTVSITHTYTADIGIELQSPSGTKSILFYVYNGFGYTDDLNAMVLLTNSFYGENSSGDWLIRVVDGYTGDTGTNFYFRDRFI